MELICIAAQPLIHKVHRGKNVPVTLKPGGEDATEGNYDLTKFFVLTKPGKYTVQYVYEEKQIGWEGRLPSNAFSFELVATPERPERVVEKDGVRFEILVPEREWAVSGKEPAKRTPVNLGIRITNNTTKATRFSRFDTLYPRMTGPDDKALRLDGGRNGTMGRVEADCPLVPPGESVTFIIDAALSWRGDELQLGGADGFGGVWLFHSLSPGAYKLRILYRNDRAESGFGPEQRIVRDVWTGSWRQRR